MNNKESYKNTEDKIRRYYQKEEKIKSIDKQLKLLKGQIDKIEKELRDRSFNIDHEQSTNTSFEERVQSSSNGSCYAEREIIRVTDIKLRRIEDKKIEIEKLEEIRDNIEKDTIDIEDIIGQLRPDLRTILEMKYKKKYNEQKIAIEIHLSQSQVNKKLRRCINIIRDWNSWRGIILE